MSLRAGVVLLAVALAGCATRPMPPPGAEPQLGRAVEQPLRDLSLIREEAPDVLQRAAIDPYDLSKVTDCATLAAEIQALDAALGPDLAKGTKSTGVSVDGLASDLIGGAVGLPFRGIVRTISGAEPRERALRAAVLAGMVRRGFLKGRLDLMHCATQLKTPG